MGMMEDLHGPEYDLYQTFCSPKHVGFAASSRSRTYVIGVHNGRTTILKDPSELQEELNELLSARCATKTRDYLMATSSEVRLEAQDVCRRRNILYQDTSDLRYVLNERERSALHEYESRYFQKFGRTADSDPDLFVFLGDNPSYSCRWSAGGGPLPTFRMNLGFYWSPKHKRWLTAKERLISMGWPVIPEIASVMECPQVPALDIKRAGDLAGNAMHFVNCGVQQLIGLTCFGPECPGPVAL